MYLGRAEQGAGLGCDDASAPHRRVTPEPRLVPAEPEEWTGDFGWLAYEGRWGEITGREFDGPLGPTTKWKWRAPLSWAETLRYSSVRVPSRETLGPSAVDAFCSSLAFVTDMLLPG